MVEHAAVRSTAPIWLAGHEERLGWNLVMNLEKLVEQFAFNVVAQTDATWRGDAKTGNKHARKYIAAFKELRAHGDAGREALAVLLKHPRPDVRTEAAAHLLRYRTEEAKAV